MFGSSVLEVAIGLIFIYLLLSLACTALNEALASVLNKRGAYLFEGVKNLLNDPAFTGLAQQIYNHGLVDSLSREATSPRLGNRLPSYLSSATFSLALLDVLSARGAIGAAHGGLLSAAERADDAFEAARAAAKSNPQRAGDLARAAAARDEARAALEAAAVQATSAVQATTSAAGQAISAAGQAARDAGVQPQGPGALQPALQANDSARTAAAALKILDARRAAIACAKDPRNADLVRAAANSLEVALAAGRTIADTVPHPLASLQQAVEQLPDGHTKESLLVLIAKTRRETTAVDRQVVAFQKNVEAWFNDAMSHVSGWYKRWTQMVIGALALVVVCGANADTIQIVQRLSRDGPLRAALVAAADSAARSAPDQDDARAKAVLEQADNLMLPLGWNRASAAAARTPLGLLAKVAGLIASVLAVSLGAPFWFDTLNKVINVRGAGIPPGESRKSP
jgi:hypothetical protein